jgi:Na+/melibiose symporter-like transporter
MVTAQLSKIICYNPAYPYLIIIPTVLLSAGMLFFFTLGASMVGDICDEDDLKTGKRTEGSFYSVFWWFIKMGTALASFVAGALIVFTLFDETQVTKVDALQGSIRELKAEVKTWQEGSAPTAIYKELLEKAQKKSAELMAHLETKAKEARKNPEHYEALRQNVEKMNHRMASMDGSVTKETIEAELILIDAEIMPLTRQTPYTLLMMRVVEIGLPLLLSLFSIFFVLRYSLTEKRSHEIKDLLRKRNEERASEENK